jgi:hypothetical protein
VPITVFSGNTGSCLVPVTPSGAVAEFCTVFTTREGVPNSIKAVTVARLEPDRRIFIVTVQQLDLEEQILFEAWVRELPISAPRQFAAAVTTEDTCPDQGPPPPKRTATDPPSTDANEEWFQRMQDLIDENFPSFPRAPNPS